MLLVYVVVALFTEKWMMLEYELLAPFYQLALDFELPFQVPRVEKWNLQ